ncbi:hypothetical protein [Aeromicrobium erythreum]|uniref:Uncharacterized protein n=1 Tax=Aeromicrobium erythreum TaxID=2041 RepID=A0A0U4CTH6_9ACTN|nr:hypothetical protein [Aeromicrobium erythreum]ALX05948.1 hypothetical protein AERYTH_15195 [Aeromicrobium erythreum]
MGIFSRRTADRPEPMDEALTFLTVSDADRVRALLHHAFGEHGLEVTTHADHAVDAEGRQFGFWNVAATCADVDRRDWPAAVQDHVRRILESFDEEDPFEGADPDDQRRRTYARLLPADALPDLDAFPHRELAPGIIEVLALDLPTTLSIYNHENARTAGGWELLHQAGLENLRALPTEQVELVDAHDGGAFHVLLGDSVHTASRALLLPELPAGVDDAAPTDLGWLMSVPHRHQLCWHVVRDATVVSVVNSMARFTALGYSDGVGQVSPHLYWWNGSAYVQLTRFDDEGTMSIHVDSDFADVLQRAMGD